MATTKQPRLPATPKPSSRAALEAKRKGFVARAPSGEYYRIRSLGIERHAFAGGMPPALAQIVTEGEKAVAQLFEELSKPVDTPEEQAAKRQTVDYLDRIVLASLLDPALAKEELGDPDDLASDSILPPDDYMWLVSVALRSVEHDADGRRLFGFDDSRVLEVFRVAHECADDCEECTRVRQWLETAAAA